MKRVAPIWPGGKPKRSGSEQISSSVFNFDAIRASISDHIETEIHGNVGAGVLLAHVPMSLLPGTRVIR